MDGSVGPAVLESSSPFSTFPSSLSPVDICEASSSADLLVDPAFESSRSVAKEEPDSRALLTGIELRRKGEGEAALVDLIANSEARRVLAAGAGELGLLGGRLGVLIVDVIDGDDVLVGGFEAGEEDLLERTLPRPDDSTGLFLPEGMAGAVLLGGGGLVTPAGLPLVGGEGDVVDEVCTVCGVTESDWTLVDGGEDSVATKAVSLVAEA